MITDLGAAPRQCSCPGGPQSCACGETAAVSPQLPPGDFFTADGQGEWHAVRRGDAVLAVPWQDRHVTRSACGNLAFLEAGLGAYDRDSGPASVRPCPECAWTAAAESGTLDREVRRLVPAPADQVTLARLIPDPVTAATAAAALTAALTRRPGRVEDEDDRHLIQVLGTLSRHAPVLLIAGACQEGSCGCPGDDHDATAACAGCSLQAGSWAGDYEGEYLAECLVPAPCQPLLLLAAAAPAMAAEAVAARQAARPATDSQ